METLATISTTLVTFGVMLFTLLRKLRDLRVELKGDMGELRTELKSDMRELRTELKSDM